ncbi:hypothetical protein N9S10_02470 [Gammaproteobacteria bacterium]|jgi:hypothetical protein|nr:hypothetical protein [Gammaproteobacteria bacterium]
MESSLARKHTTRRRAIVEALALQLEQINGTPPYRSSIAKVERRLKFWDEVNEFPTIHIGAGSETREYDGGGFRFRFLRLTIRCYASDDSDVILALEELLEDVETVLEDKDPLTYYDSTGASQSTVQTTIGTVTTDEGVLEPLGVGEITVEIRY